MKGNRESHHITSKDSLGDLLFENRAKITLYFGDVVDGGYTDHGAIVAYLGDHLYSYTLEGHGIGSNTKDPMNLEYTVKRIFADCQRFRGGDIVTSESPA